MQCRQVKFSQAQYMQVKPSQVHIIGISSQIQLKKWKLNFFVCKYFCLVIISIGSCAMNLFNTEFPWNQRVICEKSGNHRWLLCAVGLNSNGTMGNDHVLGSYLHPGDYIHESDWNWMSLGAVQWPAFLGNHIMAGPHLLHWPWLSDWKGSSIVYLSPCSRHFLTQELV